MQYRCPLPQSLQSSVNSLIEFANGGAQATVALKDGRVIPAVLVSNATAIVAARGYDAPPFESGDIASLYQTEADLNPEQRDGWRFWDTWQ
jgi:hypothetical protein